jgi:hypothetical protein
MADCTTRSNALGSRCCECRQPHPFGRRTARQNDDRRHPGRSAERHLGCARWRQAQPLWGGLGHAANRRLVGGTPAVSCCEPTARIIGHGVSASDGCLERQASGRTVDRGAPEGEQPAVGGDHPMGEREPVALPDDADLAGPPERIMLRPGCVTPRTTPCS